MNLRSESCLIAELSQQADINQVSGFLRFRLFYTQHEGTVVNQLPWRLKGLPVLRAPSSKKPGMIMRAVHHMSHSLYRTNLYVCLKSWLTEITLNACLSCQLIVIGYIRSTRIQYIEIYDKYIL